MPSPEKNSKNSTGLPGLFLGLLLLIFSMGTIPTSCAFSESVPFHTRSKHLYSSTLFKTAPLLSSSPAGETRADPSQTTPQEPVAPSKRTLYDVLQAHPDMTQAQLKQQYIKLAKQSHPDALLQNEGSVEAELDFTEIAAAWEILSDTKQRMRYDRSLQAEEFSRQVEEWAGQAFNQAVPVAQALGRVAVPFLRKTAAGTVAGVSAAANAYSKAAQAEEARAVSQDDPVEFLEDTEVVMLTPETEEMTSQSGPQPTDSKGFANAGSSNAASRGIAQDNPTDEPLRFSPSTSKPRRSTTKVSASPLFGQNVDRRSLVDKSKSLEERASKFLAEAAAAKMEMDPIMEKRLHLALHTPHSGLTASEASVLLEDLNKTVADRLSPLDRAMLRHTVLEEIDSLKRTESQFVTAQKADTQAQDIYRDAVQQRVQTAKILSEAIDDEDEARRKLAAAQELVKESRQNLADTTRALAEAEVEAKKSDYQLELQQMQMEKQAEKVRKALKQKESQARRAKEQEIRVQQQQQKSTGDRSVMLQDDPSATLLDETWYYPDDDSPERLTELRELRAEEQRLRRTSSRLDNLAARLLSRASKLQQRVQDMER